MDKILLNKLKLLHYQYDKTKGVGHTSLMKEGLINTKKTVGILCYGLEDGSAILNDPDIKNNNLGAKYCIPWTSMTNRNFMGNRKPIAIDNYAMYKILEECIVAITERDEKIKELRSELALVADQLNGCSQPLMSVYTIRSKKLIELGMHQNDDYFFFQNCSEVKADLYTYTEEGWKERLKDITEYIGKIKHATDGK